jgi:hypothetical protein
MRSWKEEVQGIIEEIRENIFWDHEHYKAAMYRWEPCMSFSDGLHSWNVPLAVWIRALKDERIYRRLLGKRVSQAAVPADRPNMKSRSKAPFEVLDAVDPVALETMSIEEKRQKVFSYCDQVFKHELLEHIKGHFAPIVAGWDEDSLNNWLRRGIDEHIGDRIWDEIRRTFPPIKAAAPADRLKS